MPEIPNLHLPMTYKLLCSRMLASAAALHLMTSCAVSRVGDPKVTTPAQDPAKRLVIQQIRKDIGAQPRLGFDVSEIRWRSERSRAVEGLTYVWGMFQPDVPSGPIAAVAGVRGDSMLALNGAAAWARLAAGWSPRSGRETVDACLEYIRFGGHGANLLDTVWVIRKENLEGALASVAQADLVRSKLQATDGQARTENGTWFVELWVRERRSRYDPFAIKYRCDFLASGRVAGAPLLAAIDSVPSGKPAYDLIH